MEEFEHRHANSDFESWRSGLETSDAGKDYLARAHRMTHDERETFFFQEFVRRTHPSRIRSWIAARPTTAALPGIEPIARAIRELIAKLPSRFRDYLATVCESHHSNNLDRADLYPMFAAVGDDPKETVNVQYAAVILRTADLLHVTQDRTPSIMYQIIRFTDPKAVEEWDKQRGVFGVRPKHRELDESNPATAAILVSADFSAERPFFALQEYIAYANAEIDQSRRWVTRSSQTPDARNYRFPWHTVEGDVRLEGVPPHRLSFQLDRARLLDLLVGHTLYNDPTVAIRELLQNAIDAVRYQHYLDRLAAEAAGRASPPIGSVTVRWDPHTRALSVHDDGIGMDRDTIENHLMKVGASYYNTPQFVAEHKHFAPISRFGIGILTSFMISDDIEIITTRNGKSHRLRMTSVHADYLLRELTSDDERLSGLRPHGTRVTLRLRDSIRLAGRYPIERILRHWIVLPECPVHFVDDKEKRPIGFSGVKESLVQLLNAADTDDADSMPSIRRGADTDLNVVVSRRVEDGEQRASYELAMATRRGRLGVDLFATGTGKFLPLVCIEGIRVASAIPGFSGNAGRDALPAVLSVRGTRQLRTTVSRSDLEIDEEYRRVAVICADLLFDHTASQIDTVATRSGRPLSQAASVARWMLADLRKWSRPEVLGPAWRTKTKGLRSVVMERDAGQPSRQLITLADLAKLDTFWTVDSRLMDSLNVISRDLGKELSLQEFVATMASDRGYPRHSPSIADAAWHVDDMSESHAPASVTCSKEHQLTAVRWERRSGAREDQALADLAERDRKVRERLAHTMAGMVTDPELRQRDLSDSFLEQARLTYVAKLVGEIDNIDVVRTTTVNIIRSDSPIGKLFVDAQRACVADIVSGKESGYLLAIMTLVMGWRIGKDMGQDYDLGYGMASRVLEPAWRECLRGLQGASLHGELLSRCPEDVKALLRDRVEVFDAAWYWWDWGTTQAND
jgi:hypothetical protein